MLFDHSSVRAVGTPQGFDDSHMTDELLVAPDGTDGSWIYESKTPEYDDDEAPDDSDDDLDDSQGSSQGDEDEGE